MKKINLLLLASVLCSGLNAQKWTQMLNDTNANFYDIVKEFDTYWKDREVEKGKGYKAFKRWQWFMEPRVYPSGDMRLAARGHALEELKKFNDENSGKKLSSASVNATTANWTPLGPFGSPAGGDAGRVQTIRMHPSNANTFYVGTAAGGFWMTNNGGTSYTTTTDQIGSCGVSDIAVDPINPLNIYISTGDKDGGDTHSIGVLKSTNGGLTWSATGLAWTTSQQRKIYRLLVNPQNPNTLIAATSVGMYKSVNAGLTWTLSMAGGFVDAEYRPGDTTTVYGVSNGGFIRSLNGGNSYSNVSIANNISSTRLSLAVTAANNNYVYILVGATNNGFGGLYRSVNNGSVFTLMSSSPNIFDWSTNGSGTGGQAWYDIAIDASPTNADEIICGGVNSWKSINGGTSWTLNSHWTGSGGRPYVHADLHHVLYVNGTTVYLGTDGGVARTTNSGTNYTTINGNMNIAQIYKMGLSTSTASQIICGHQDNGSNLLTGTSWAQEVGGDGMDCFVDRTNNNVMVASTQNGGFRRTTNGGNSWNGITNGLTGSAPWVSPIVQDPVNANTYYCGYQDVFKSTNQGTNWTKISTMAAGIDEIKIAPSNNSVIYATYPGGIWKTSNGGTSWSNISGTVIAGGQVSDLAVSNQNANIIFVTVTGYSAGNKVFASYDGGGTWTNYSNGLPNIPVNCIVYKNNSNQALYVGTDVGVYYREGSMSSWTPYFNGLPNIVVFDLEIYYPTGKLRAATYARGVWETDLYSDPTSAPTSAFYTSFSPGCINTPLQFNDLSSNTPTAWVWSFAGGSPASSTLQNPLITYNTAGIYTVSLVSTNSNGNSVANVTTISVVGSPTYAPVSSSVCVGQTSSFSVNTNASTINWSTGQQGLSINVSSSVNTVYSFTASLGACNTVGTASLFVDPIPPTPNIVTMPGYLTTTVTGVSYQWYLNSSPISGATSVSYTPTANGYYSLWVNIGNCSASSPFVQIILDGLNTNNLAASTISIRPNPVKDELIITNTGEQNALINYEIMNNIGQLVAHSEQKTNGTELKINTNALAQGIYYLTVTEKSNKTVFKFVKQ